MSASEGQPRIAELFRESKGRPISFRGQTVYLAYEIGVSSVGNAQLVVTSHKLEPIQGICLETDKGQLEINGVRGPGMVLWMDVAPKNLAIEFSDDPTVLRVWNCWRGKFGQRDAWIGSAGMIVDVLQEQSVGFHCSDGPGDVDFTAIEFDLRLEI